MPDPPPHPGSPGDAERRKLIAPGDRLGWTLAGPRGCCGIWAGTRRLPCPLRSPLADSTSPQCRACAGADPGQALARDTAGDDGRDYRLYLAWFGPGLLKIGLTAADRGRDRLLEQGAITYALLAAGPYARIRRAEQLVSGAGLARERIPARARAAAWRDLPAPASRAAEVTAARTPICRELTRAGGLTETPGPVVDQAADFGLDHALPASWDEVTAITGPARLAGELTAVVGRQILLATAAGTLLVDMRRVAGWALAAGPAPAGDAPGGEAHAGLTTVSRTPPEEAGDDQPALF